MNTLPKSFEDLIRESDKPVLADFWAEWCGPCRTVSPVIEQIAREYSGRLLTVKVNVDQKPHVAEAYQISSIPTIMLFFRGQGLMRLLGAYPKDEIVRQIEVHWPR